MPLKRKIYLIIKKIITTLSLLFLLFSCSEIQKREVNPLGTGLDIDREIELIEKPRIRDGQKKIPGITPVQSKKAQNVSVVKSLIFGPGMYRTVAYIPLLKEFKNKGFKLPIVGGHGMASIIAAAFAFGEDPDLIEWKFHKFFNAAKDEEIYTEKWFDILDKKLLAQFKGKRIEQAQLKLFVPVFDNKKNRIKYLTRGDLYLALSANINLAQNKNLYGPAFKWEIFNIPLMKKLGADKIIGVDVLDEGFTLKSSDGFLYGTFSKAVGKSSKESIHLDHYLSFQLENMTIDTPSDATEILSLAREQSPGIIKVLTEKRSFEK
jgi:hypothetical protein